MKGADVVIERGADPSEPTQQAGRLSGTPLDALGRLTYLSMPEAADYLRKPSVKAFAEWARRERLSKCRTGRSVLFLRRDLDDAVQPEHVKARSHARTA